MDTIVHVFPFPWVKGNESHLVFSRLRSSKIDQDLHTSALCKPFQIASVNFSCAAENDHSHNGHHHHEDEYDGPCIAASSPAGGRTAR